MIKYFLILLSFLILSSCETGSNHQKNQERMDELFGCKNPQKKLSKEKYKQCLAQQRSGGDSFFDLDGDLNDLISGKNGTVIYQYSVNPHLWKASLDVTKSYPLKIADNQGGYIETDWINDNNQRCLIKIRILSQELVSTGVSTSFVCENKMNNSWVSDKKEYLEEEKQLTLKILKIAADLSNTNL
jgi:hypothetical protein